MCGIDWDLRSDFEADMAIRVLGGGPLEKLHVGHAAEGKNYNMERTRKKEGAIP